MPIGFDTTTNCAKQAISVRARNYDFIARYLSKSTWKLIGAAEASAIRNAGLSLVLVYEDGSTSSSYFSASRGETDAIRAAAQATALGAPPDTAIYFAVDYDATNADISGCITDYFKGVADVLNAAGHQSRYSIGVYGSGSTCRAIEQSRLARYTWLAQSKGWSGYDPKGPWSIVQGMPTIVGPLSVDPDTAFGDYGAFSPKSDT